MKTMVIGPAIGFMWLLAACSNKKEPFKEERLVLAIAETKVIKQIDLAVTNQGCGRKWISKGDEPSYEKAYCAIDVKYQDSIFRMGNDLDPVCIGDIELKVEQMNPWGREEDSIPPGGCRILVKRVASPAQ